MPPKVPARPRRQPPELEGMWCNDGGCTASAVARCSRCQYVFCAEHEGDHLNEANGCEFDEFGESD
jgi:hypothetical protein